MNKGADYAAQGRSDSGRFAWSTSKDGNTVSIFDNGRHVTALPTKDFKVHGAGMLAAFDKGEAYTPVAEFAGQMLSPEQAREARLTLLEAGGNMTRDVDKWVRHLAATEAREGGMFADSINKVPAEQWPAFTREVFDSLYTPEPKQLEEKATGAEWIGELMNQAEAQSEWSKLREQVQGDPWACGIASGRIASSLADKANELLAQLPKEDPQRLAEDAQVLEDTLGKRNKLTKAAKEKAAGAAEQAAAFLTELSEFSGQQDVGDPTVAEVFAAAAGVASKEVKEIQKGSVDMADLSTGALKSLKAAPETMRRVLAENPNLRKLVELAGRMRLRARAKQRTKTKYVPDSIVDVTIGGELERLLPVELGCLAMPETELLVMNRILERQALQYDLEGEERLDQGPVILAVDSSGSMQGIRNQWAMAVAIAVLEVAAMQRRPFVLMHFDGKVQAKFTVEKPSALGLEKLLEMVSFFSGGGTNFSHPLSDAHEIITGGKKKDGVFARADVMLITDGQATWGQWAQKIKEAGASLYGVAIEEKFSADMAAEMTGCAYVSPALLADGKADVDLLFGI